MSFFNQVKYAHLLLSSSLFVSSSTMFGLLVRIILPTCSTNVVTSLPLPYSRYVVV